MEADSAVRERVFSESVKGFGRSAANEQGDVVGRYDSRAHVVLWERAKAVDA